MKRAVAYLRVSTKAQVDKDPDGLSLPVQKQYAEQKAAQLDAVIVEYYVERGQSARTMRRDELQRLCARLRESRDLDYVIVLSLNRLARDVGDFDRLWDDYITPAGAELVSVLETFDNTPGGRFMAHVSQLRRSTTQPRRRSGCAWASRARCKVGGTSGLAPLGYRNVSKIVDGRTVKSVGVDPERAPQVVEAFELYATGDWSLPELLDEVTKRGFRTRATRARSSKPLALAQLHRMLKNPYYCGDVTHRGARYEGRHEALIDRELFERVQSVMSAHYKAGEREQRHRHYLKGLLVCHRCGSRMTLAVTTKGYRYFYCLGRHRRNGCDQPYLPIEAVEREVLAAYRGLQVPERDVAWLRLALAEHLSEEEKRRARVVERARRTIARLDGERTRLLQAHLAGAVPLDLLQREQARLSRELGHAQAQLATAEARDHDELAVTLDEATALLLDPEATYRALPHDELRRQYNMIFFERLEVDGVQLTAHVMRPMAALVEMAREGGRAYQRSRGTQVPASELDLTERSILVAAGVRTSSIWSGRRESNPRSQLGKLMFCR